MRSSFLPALVLLSSLATSEALEIREKPVSPDELASALGVRPYCADLVLDGATYPRLVAEIKDSEGRVVEQHVTARGGPHKVYRIRVFVFEDVQTRVPQRIIFNLSADDMVAANAFVAFPAGSRIVQINLSPTGNAFYEAWVFGPQPPDHFFSVRLRIETSTKPYPVPSSHFEVMPK
jgi:hypothetical protein